VVEHKKNDLKEKKTPPHLNRSKIELSRQGKAGEKKGKHKSKVSLWSD
jgi:hypothetical protein